MNGGSRFIVGNVFAYRATDVRTLATVADPVGPDNGMHLARIIADADVLVPCWGRGNKLPRTLHGHLDRLRDQLLATGKPVLILGLSQSGDPLHPLTLSYSTPLTPWQG